MHAGPYDELTLSYQALEKYAKDNAIELEGVAWEHYLSDPAVATDPTLLQTLIAMPLKTK